MKKAFGHNDNAEEVRRICRDINERSNDREKLQTLVVRLQEVLSKDLASKDRNDARLIKVGGQRDNPFDRIMIG